MLFVCHPNGKRIKMALRETEDNAYAKFWGDRQRASWYVIVFSGVVNNGNSM